MLWNISTIRVPVIWLISIEFYPDSLVHFNVAKAVVLLSVYNVNKGEGTALEETEGGSGSHDEGYFPLRNQNKQALGG